MSIKNDLIDIFLISLCNFVFYRNSRCDLAQCSVYPLGEAINGLTFKGWSQGSRNRHINVCYYQPCHGCLV